MTDVISFNASSTLSGGVGAKVNVLLDGKVIGSTTVGTATATYSFNTTLTANTAHDIQIQYTNDTTSNGQDRNLKLNSIGINGQSVSATSSLEVYHANGQGDIKSSGAMNWGGTAEFKLPASYFPGSSAPSHRRFLCVDIGQR